jgi:DNA repair exonuclease SbcCD ATPase subunit
MFKMVLIGVASLIVIGCSSGMQPFPVTDAGGQKFRDRVQYDTEVDERLIVSSADLEVKTDQSDTLHNRVIRLADKYGGYVLSSGGNETSIRIPSTGFNSAIEDIEKMGEIIEKKITGKDVTEQYSDLETRLDNAEKTRQRYLALLDKAKNMDEILRLEKELERLNSQIEMLKGRIERLSHLVQYSTITVKSFKEVHPGPVAYALYQVFSGVKWLFVRN